MRAARAARTVLAATVCLGLSGCGLFKKGPPKIAAPVAAPQPATAPAPVQPAPVQPPVVQEPAPEPLPPLETTPLPAEAVPAAPKETPAPKPAVRRSPVQITPAPAPATPVAPVVPAPPLREILSGEQRRQYEAEFSQGLARAAAALKQASTRRLTANQRATVARIRTFIAQANAMRDHDISTALQLARRADLLGEELLKSLR